MRNLIYDPFIPLSKITESISILEMLHRYLTEDECNRVITLAILKIVRSLRQNSISTWYDRAYLSVVIPARLSSQRNSELKEKIGSSDLYRRFSLDLIRKLNPESSLLYDITSIPSYSVASIFEYGHARITMSLNRSISRCSRRRGGTFPSTMSFIPEAYPTS